MRGIALLAGLGIAAAAPAQPGPLPKLGQYIGSDGQPRPVMGSGTVGYASATALAVGTSYAPGLAFMSTCTQAGTATVTMADGTTAQIAVGVGTSAPLPLSVRGVTTSSGTCTFYSLASVGLPSTGGGTQFAGLDLSQGLTTAAIPVLF